MKPEIETDISIRNINMLKEYLQGVSTKNLAKKYNLTRDEAWLILWEEQKERPQTPRYHIEFH